MNTKTNKVDVVVDLGYGSTGKGACAFWLSRNRSYDTVISINGFQAGHTAVSKEGRKWVHLALPTGLYIKKNVLIAPGAAFYPAQLALEIEGSKDLLSGKRIGIHECATVGKQWMADEEASSTGMQMTGSTKMGFGAAQAAKARRRPDVIARDSMELLEQHGLAQYVVTHQQYLDILRDSESILLESSQGYSLSLNAGMYPYCTSRDCTTSATLSATHIPPQWVRDVFGVARLYPIRVNNQQGSSGPCYQDQEETSFGAIGQPVELTTVTKLPRRVFTFSMQQVLEAVQVNGVTDIVLSFADYNPPLATELANTIDSAVASNGGEARVNYLTVGPSESDFLTREQFVASQV